MEIRLNKLLSRAGICSRREADELIEMGRVTVNGVKSRLGQHITEEDIVEVDGERVRFSKRMEMEEEKAQAAAAEKTPGTQKPRRTWRENYGKPNKYVSTRRASMGEGDEMRKPSGHRQYGSGNSGSGSFSFRKTDRSSSYGNKRGTARRGQRDDRRGR